MLQVGHKGPIVLLFFLSRLDLVVEGDDVKEMPDKRPPDRGKESFIAIVEVLIARLLRFRPAHVVYMGIQRICGIYPTIQ